MLKNIFKSAKKLLKNPVVQLGIGAFLPNMLPASMGILRNPAILQAGIGALAGDKPADIARNVGIQALLGGFRGMGEGGGGFTEGVKRTFMTPTGKVGTSLSETNPYEAGTVGGTSSGGIENLLKGASGKIIDAIIENPIRAAEAGLLLTALLQGQDDPRLQDVDPNVILDRSRYKQELEESPFQNATGGIAGYKMGGEKKTSIGINSNTGEPSGMVTGPGTGKSDSIRFVSSKAKVPTDISNGEFIFTKESTDKIGPENLYALMTSVDKDAETFEEGQERMAMA
tara:strand:- start:14 stop:868 length:855 start_codon:yes stop_codon:yes gene_type:complete